MARKLYIFNPLGKIKPNAQTAPKWIGGFSADYAFLGDEYARLLGVGNALRTQSRPNWLQIPPVGTRPTRSGASRYDGSFSDWG